MILDEINKRVENIINQNKDPDSIIVLKGINNVNLDKDIRDVCNNKMKHFFDIINNKRAIIYEEFLALYPFIVEQFKNIIVIENNLFLNQFIIPELFNDVDRQAIINHFADFDNFNEEDNVNLGDIEEFVSLYDGIIEKDNILIGVYNESKVEKNKITIIPIFEDVKKLYKIQNLDETHKKITYIYDETDYVCLINDIIYNNVTNVFVSNDNYANEKIYKEIMENHLAKVASILNGIVNVVKIKNKKESNKFEHKKEYVEILKKYWGYDSFRNLKIYDIDKLEDGEKEVVEISQENIISDLIIETEKCNNKESARDMFVTAPTGAGKSVMFQIPAMYLAEKYKLLTIVITPLIALMSDQVANLEKRGYYKAKTINSNISPILKEEIIEKVSKGDYDILYISPETLLSRSDVEQLIGNRIIGMIIIDEAHIVTTWGKQFRPDYWYLGDHIKKLKKKQNKEKGQSFVVAAFTATAIYKGIEDMYDETLNSLNMFKPITYLGYVKRNDINIVINKMQKQPGRNEYEILKFNEIEKMIKRSIVTNKKVLIYFPTVALIDRCYDYFKIKGMTKMITKYHGVLEKSEKDENMAMFKNKDKLIMFATKAFGMGVDIDDIEIVAHFAPTGNVCDYVQEIGRVARRNDLNGEANYSYNSLDFKYINFMHGMSTIKSYHLTKVIDKILAIYDSKILGNKNDNTRKRNSLLVDAESFSYIFGNNLDDQDDNINKVKTALLIIQKDFENKIGFSPIVAKPIPLFAMGYFWVDEINQIKLLADHPRCLEVVDAKNNICLINLEKIWENNYKSHSFPQFKYLVYSKSDDIDFNQKYQIYQALCVNIDMKENEEIICKLAMQEFEKLVNENIMNEKYVEIDELAKKYAEDMGISIYKSKPIIDVFISSIESYMRNQIDTYTRIMNIKILQDNTKKVQFTTSMRSFFKWINEVNKHIHENINVDGSLYLCEKTSRDIKAYNIVLGIMEAVGAFNFKMIGGANSQIYIYLNQKLSLEKISKAPHEYKNKILEMVLQRHKISVLMMKYIFEENLASNEIWNLLEDYFVGKIPNKIVEEMNK